MKSIGITGINGFIGTYLKNILILNSKKYKVVISDKSIFKSDYKMDLFIKKCDVLVHLAGMNRNNDDDLIYKTNINLASKLIESLKRTNSTPHIIFSSSLQENNNNIYGLSKKKARKMFIDWASINNAVFTGMIIPNVFGPFGKPYYNSVVSTFCYEICSNLDPTIKVDSKLNTIYIGELIQEILKLIDDSTKDYNYNVKETFSIKVSEILSKLLFYKEKYILNKIIPKLKNNFDLFLFNTLRSYEDIKSIFPVKYISHDDERGSFTELIKLEIGGQVSFSTTQPNITRGNHFHTRKIERFSVVKGEALISLRKIGSDEILEYKLTGESPSFIDMPVWYTHNIKNIGNSVLYTIFWINEIYNPKNPDTYFENVKL